MLDPGKYLYPIPSPILVGIWFLYSMLCSYILGRDFKDTLRLDAYTYLPLCFLTISILQFQPLFTYHFQGLILLLQYGEFFLLLIIFIAVFHLKIEHFRTLQYGAYQVSRPSSLSAILGGEHF